MYIALPTTKYRCENASLAGSEFVDANYSGMRIEGILVTDLLRAYREQAGT